MMKTMKKIIMMKTENNMKIGFLAILGLMFIGFKLCNVITWSWWLVLLPLYAVPAFMIGAFLLVIIGSMLDAGLTKWANNIKETKRK